MEIILFTGSFEQEASKMDETENKKRDKILQEAVNLVFESPGRKAVEEAHKLTTRITETLQRLGVDIDTADGEIGGILDDNSYSLEEVAELLEKLEARQKRKELGRLQGLETIPTSPLLHEVARLLNGAGLSRDVRHGKDTKAQEWTDQQGIYNIATETKAATTFITVDNMESIMSRYDKNLRKIFSFLLQKANKNQMSEATFYLSELVELGMYANESSARRGLNNVMNKLTSIKISGELKKGNKIVKSGLYVMFTTLEINKSFCTVKINPDLNLQVIAPYFSLLPAWSYSLSGKAFSIIENIFYLARNNVSKIKNQGYFTIKLETINDYLQQPSPKYTDKHSQYIINPLLEAITEIEDKQTDTDYKFTPIYNPDYKNAHDFLKNGYLKVELTAEAKEYFIKRYNDQEKEYKKVAKRKEKALLENEKKKAENQAVIEGEK